MSMNECEICGKEVNEDDLELCPYCETWTCPSCRENIACVNCIARAEYEYENEEPRNDKL